MDRRRVYSRALRSSIPSRRTRERSRPSDQFACDPSINGGLLPEDPKAIQKSRCCHLSRCDGAIRVLSTGWQECDPRRDDYRIAWLHGVINLLGDQGISWRLLQDVWCALGECASQRREALGLSKKAILQQSQLHPVSLDKGSFCQTL